MEKNFKAFVIRETSPGQFGRFIENRTFDELPAGDILIRVEYSSLNYKDALAVSGRRGIIHYPGTPGVDAAGVVMESIDRRFKSGDQVIVGIDLRKTSSGGFEQFIRVPVSWVMRLPYGLSLRDAAIYGVAGFTAGLCVENLKQHGVQPDMGEILVTGATGGVGSFALGILTKAGYNLVAVSGKPGMHDYLKFLGASRIIDRREFDTVMDQPLLYERWAGVIDTVGGNILSTAIRSTRYNGVVVCCGNVASNELHTSILPFILRGVRLIGIDAVQTPKRIRQHIWKEIAGHWRLDTLDTLAEEISLTELSGRIDNMLSGSHTGRTIIKLTDT